MLRTTSIAVTLAAITCTGAAAQQPGQQPLVPRGVTVRTVGDTIPGGVGGVAVDRSGAIYSADFNDNVWKITPDGRRTLFATGLYGASGNNFDPRGRLLQSNFYGNYIARISRTGEITVIAEGLNGPVGLVQAPDGNIFVVNCRGNSVSRVTPDGEVSQFSTSPLYQCPNGIRMAPDGTLFVINFGNGGLIKVDQSGEASLFATIPGNGGGHVAIARGRLFVTAFQSNRIFQVSMDGEVTLVAGTGQFGERDGPADQALFTFPNGIAVGPTGDRLYVNDYINRFPPTLESPPAPLSVVRQITLPGYSDILLAALLDGGVEAMRAAHDDWKNNPATASQFTEREMNAFGYRLMNAGRITDAIAAFQINVQAYPNSFNTYDSLGEAYMNAGNNVEAIANYERSLELNPSNANATSMIQRIRSQ